MKCLGLSEMLLCKLEQILCCSQESQLENTTDTFCPPAAFDSARKTREGLFPKWKCYDKWAWGGLIEVCLSSTLTLWLPHSLFLSTFASLAHTLLAAKPISHHRCLAGRSLFLCFSPTFHSQSQAPYPISNRQPTPLTHTSLTRTPTPLPPLTVQKWGLFLELCWWFMDVKSTLCHGFSARKQAVSLLAPSLPFHFLLCILSFLFKSPFSTTPPHQSSTLSLSPLAFPSL